MIKVHLLSFTLAMFTAYNKHYIRNELKGSNFKNNRNNELVSVKNNSQA